LTETVSLDFYIQNTNDQRLITNLKVLRFIKGRPCVCPEFFQGDNPFMKKAYKAYIVLLMTTFLITILLTGCAGISPSAPDDEYDQENIEVAYLKVFPSSATVGANQTKKFEVKAYNSEDKLVSPDLSKIKWACAYECIACGVVCNLSSRQGSLQTTFSAERTGEYEVWAKFEGTENKWAKAVVQVN